MIHRLLRIPLTLLLLTGGCALVAGISLQQYERLEITPWTLALHYNPFPSSLWQFASTGMVAVNSSYFWGDFWSGYIPAGIWYQSGVEIAPVQYRDPNLNILAIYDPSRDPAWSFWAIGKWNQWQCASAECVAFQAGPILIDRGVRRSEFYGSWHAYSRHYRTMLAITRSGRMFVIVFPVKITLPKAVRQIRRDTLFKADPLITLLNLDGGSSTAYIADRGSFFATGRRLPMVWTFVEKTESR